MTPNKPTEQSTKDQRLKYQLLIGHKVKIDNDHFGEILELRELHARVKYIGEGGERTSLIEYERLSVNYPNKEIKNKDIVSERDYWRMHYNKTQDTLDKVTTGHYHQPDNKAVDLDYITKNIKYIVDVNKDSGLNNNSDFITEKIIELIKPYLSTPQKAISEGYIENVTPIIYESGIEELDLLVKKYCRKEIELHDFISNLWNGGYNACKSDLTEEYDKRIIDIHASYFKSLPSQSLHSNQHEEIDRLRKLLQDADSENCGKQDDIDKLNEELATAISVNQNLRGLFNNEINLRSDAEQQLSDLHGKMERHGKNDCPNCQGCGCTTCGGFGYL